MPREKIINGNVHVLLDCIEEVLHKGEVTVKDLRIDLGRYLHEHQIPDSRTINIWLVKDRRNNPKWHAPSGEYCLALLKWLSDSVSP